MIDQFVGLLLLGLGLKTSPYTNSNVKGDETTATETITPTLAATNTSTTSTNDTNTNKRKDRSRLPPILGKPVRSGNDDRMATRPGEEKDRIRIDAKQTRENLIKNRQDFIEEMKIKRASAQAEFKEKQDAFKEKLAEIKDARKKSLVKKLNTRCQEVHKKRTDAMTGMLTKFSSILENVTNRAATAKTNGKDIASVDVAVTAAQTAITTAQTAVAAQAGKECMITIHSEKVLKTDVSAAINGLEKELKAVNEAVIVARKAVGNAVKALALVLGESLTVKVTPTVTSIITP